MRINIRLTAEEREALERVVERERSEVGDAVTLSAVVRTAIRSFLATQRTAA